ncbi:MAG: exo-alpha-sialidase [Opitutae bacterium]|jgi:sialidase-1|nr:exo-alpha-sialidase [Opitutae bacterium]MBT5379891.1 exo-alpha-sialidase [Opitutae bacterium]MBT5692466.1 exo-alpha-sialidase [Opitutae bacterium]MBT6461498.1 exo-alpha-sialidase [Opitutae bacterium]
MRNLYQLLPTFLAIVALALTPCHAKENHPVEGPLNPFLGEAKLDIQQVHKGGRFPNVVVAMDGSILAVWNGVIVKRSEDGGDTWGEAISVGKGFMGGGVTVNERNGEIIAFVEERHPPATQALYHSTDHGKTWAKLDAAIKPDSKDNLPSFHMNEHGITLRHGENAGRLIRASRWYAGQNHRSKWPQHYTNAMYSDDGGKTWSTSEPFPAKGTGEATLAELSDGRVYYNTRRHWAEEGANPRRRWHAWSEDGGVTWKDFSICEILPDGPQSTNYGCMAGLTRLAVKGRDIVLYCNCDSAGGRDKGTVWASFDGGRTWPVKRLVQKGRFAYSSMTSGRPGTKTEGLIYIHYEGGGGSAVARFNLAWVLDGSKTGNGEIPDWLNE